MCLMACLTSDHDNIVRQHSKTASKRLRHVIYMMIHHHKYSTNVNSNSRGYLPDSLVRIKEGENVKSSRGRDGLHDG